MFNEANSLRWLTEYIEELGLTQSSVTNHTQALSVVALLSLCFHSQT